MHKETITYTDYDGNSRTEDYYFNLTSAEVITWLTASQDFALDKVLDRIVQKQNVKEIMQIFEDLIYRSYGEKSLDGRRFVKSKDVKDAFVETEAYSILFTGLVTDAKKAADFFNAIIPAELAAEVDKIMKENPNGVDISKLPELTGVDEATIKAVK